MSILINENLKKCIKKNIYAKAHVAKIIFPPGFGAVAFKEAKEILSNLWIAKKFTGNIHLLKNEIQVRPVYMLAIIELLLRNHCFSDVRLTIFKETTLSKKSFEKKCKEVDWNFYINKTMSVKIKVNSVASTAFHETGLKEIITEIIKPYVKEVVSGENTDETTCLFIELYKNKLTISISLAGQPLYKRGFRGQLSASAPLREDIAACCIHQALLFSTANDLIFTASAIFIPFSGTGTFAFEYIQMYYQFMPALLLRNYALEKMPFFKKEHFSLLKEKSKETCSLFQSKSTAANQIKLICVDKSIDANSALKNNLLSLENTAEKNNFSLPDIHIIQDDFFSLNLNVLSGNLFIPLNPPYGIRLEKDSNSQLFYKKIAHKINDLFNIAKKNKYNVLGFILCPNEETWSIFVRNLDFAITETYHFTQGGLDIRVCQFLFKP